jgi:hypothetical protein
MEGFLVREVDELLFEVVFVVHVELRPRVPEGRQSGGSSSRGGEGVVPNLRVMGDHE